MSKKENNHQPLSFPQLEDKVLQFWDQADIFNKSVNRKAPQGDYVFYDGPPFATGTPHYGHIVASIMKDVVPRYQSMRGYRVERKWGWDCHGLPIENIVEKELNIKTKKEIVDLGVDKFDNLCQSRVLTYVDDWKKVIHRLGRWVDMEAAYKTMDLDFMDSVWWAFKQLWDKGLIYKDYRSMHICPRCETTLSQSEVAEGYRDIKDLSCIAKFELIDEPGTYVLAWTTTPWTLVANVALAVGTDIRYAKVQSGGEQYIVAVERLADVFSDQDYKIIKEYKGVDLLGKKYKPPFSFYYQDKTLLNRERGWQIYGADFVTTTDGTGVVHIAPAFGEDDMNLGQKEKLPFVQHVGLNGVFKEETGDLAGLQVKPLGDHMATDVEIIKYLAHKNLLFKKEKYQHSYPHCWRCDTPLINYATSSWFVAVTKIKDRLLEKAKNIKWSPDYIKEGRFGNWLEGARDWSISRQRFWASVIPIWECQCGERRVVSGVAELEKLTGKKIDDIHKDKVDQLTFKCNKCGGEMKRIEDVLDCWFESASMPFAQLHYPRDNKKKFEKNFPAQFIAEGIDQTRAWFYYLHVMAGGVFNKHAFQNVIVNGIVLAEDGKKMSKRLQNYPDPMKIMEKYGSDALRIYLASSPVMQAENLNFSEKNVQESLRKNIMLLWNVYKFYDMFKNNSDNEKNNGDQKSNHVLDRWILAKLDILIATVTQAMEAYNLPKAARPLTEFINELSTWYLRRSRDRFKSQNRKDVRQALQTTKYVLLELSKLMAPFMPFMAENIWQGVQGYNFTNPDKSVHLEAWPRRVKEKKNGLYRAIVKKEDDNQDDVLEQMSLARKIVELGLAQRDSEKIKIRQMLNELKVYLVDGKTLKAEYIDLIKAEVNIKTLSLLPQEDKKERDLKVELDTFLTEELKQEGMKRELIRFVNLLRKNASLDLSDKSIIYLVGGDESFKKMLAEKQADILRDTLSSEIKTFDDSVKVLGRKEIKIAEQNISLTIAKAEKI